MSTALPGSAVLRAEGVSAGYGGVEIIREISLEVQAGEIVTIIGPNGALVHC